MRLGLLGGSFDPIHYAHLLLAERAREQLALEQVWLIPAATAPHKRDRRQTPVEQRIAMADLAAVDNPGLVVSRLEADRDGPSYTADTLRRLTERQADAELFFLVGADMLADLPSWYEPEVVCRMATIAAVRRPGNGEPDYSGLGQIATAERIEHFRRHQVDMPAIDISSTDIRRRVAEGRSIRYMTSPAVAAYIRAHGLYQ